MTDKIVTKKAKTFTDRIVGATIVGKNVYTATTVDDDEELKENIRNRIVFWSCVVGGICQIANLAYTYFKL